MTTIARVPPDQTGTRSPMARQPRAGSGRTRGTRMPLRVVAGIAVLALLLVACGASGALEVRDARSRMSPMLTGVGAVYLDIENGTDADAQLVAGAVDSSVAGAVEIHETFDAGGMEGDGSGMEGDGGGMDDGAEDMDDGAEDMDDDGAMDGGADTMDPTPEGFAMMGMREIDALTIPAGETVELLPGGTHIMLLDLADDLVPGDTFELTLTFVRAGDMTVTVEVREDVAR